MTKRLTVLLALLILTGVAYAAEWVQVEDITAIDSNTAEGYQPTMDKVFKSDANGNIAISIAPYSASGTVSAVNLPAGSTANPATVRVITFPSCTNTDTSSSGGCSPTKQINRVIGASQNVPLAGLIIEDQVYGFIGVQVDSMALVGSADKALRVRYLIPNS